MRTNGTAEELAKPRRDAEHMGTESIVVLGTAHEAEVWSWVDTVEAGPMSVKVWRCDQIPGRIVREETAVKDRFGKSVTTVMQVLQVEIANDDEQPE